MLQKLYEDQVLEIDGLLTKESKRLKLSPNELVVLKTLFGMYKKKLFSISSISKKIELSVADIEKSVTLLEEKGYVSFSLEMRNEKQVEVFDLSGTFQILTNLIENDVKERKKAKSETFISETISKLEQALGRMLSSLELETVRSWYDENIYAHEMIISKINEHQDSGRFSLKFLERSLNQVKLKSEPVDEAADRAIDQIFKAIK